MKKFRCSRKAQNLVEFLIIGALVSVAALVFISPYANNIKSQLINMAPEKSADMLKSANLASLFGNGADTVSNAIKTLENSNNTNANTLANEALDAISTVSNINNGTPEKISDDTMVKLLNTLAKNPKETSSETSGSIANIITATDLSAADIDTQKAGENLMNELKTKLITITSCPTLVSLANSLVSALQNDIESGKITNQDLAAAGVTADNIQNYKITETTEQPIANLAKVYCLANTLIKSGKGSATLATKYSQLNDQAKKALK